MTTSSVLELFCADVLGLQVLDEDETRYAKFEGESRLRLFGTKGLRVLPIATQSGAVL